MNYDFHKSLSPIEFEAFVRDILEIREGRKFENFGVGPDGGIDLRSEHEGHTIICQVKCFKDDFRQLRSTLRNSEVLKVKKMNPDRYILATSQSLLPQQKDEIRELFKPHIACNEDVLGRQDLNALLGHPTYHDVERRHYKLWITSSNLLISLLEAELRRGEYNETSAQLEAMQQQLPRYVQNRSFMESLDILKCKRFVLITGPPGIGKTMLGRALAMHLIERDGFEFVFVRGSIRSAWNQYRPERRQVFFLDDFWGSVFERDPSNRNEDKSLLSFLEKIQGDQTKAAIITSREYVFQRASQRQNYAELGRFLTKAKCMVTQQSFSKMNRARILYNHLYFSTLSRGSLQDIVWGDGFLQIIHHQNYNPRAIEQFIDRRFGSSMSLSTGNFLTDFLDYLKDPYDYWIDAFENQNGTARMIVLILAVSSSPMRWTSLLETLSASVIHAASIGIEIDLSQADESLKELDQTFILTKDYYGYDLTVSFQNASLVDVLIRYISSKMTSWGRILLHSATFFNQLTYAFTTEENEKALDGYISYENEVGKPIFLKGMEADLLRARMLSDFDNLNFSIVDGWLDSRFSLGSRPTNTAPGKLICMGHLFDMHSHDDVKSFICERYRQIENCLFNSDERGIAKAALKDLSSLIKLVQEHIEINGSRIIQRSYEAATFVEEIICWADLADIFPNEYRSFLAQNAQKIRHRVRRLIIEDAEWHGNDGDDYQLDNLFDWQIDAVLDQFNMKKSERLMRAARLAAGIDPDEKQDTKVNFEKSLPENRETEEKFDKAKVREDFGGLLIDSRDDYISSEDRDGFIEALVPDARIREMLQNAFRSENFRIVASDKIVIALCCAQSSYGLNLNCGFDDLLYQLAEYELTSNLKHLQLKASLDDILALFGQICFNYHFQDENSLFEIQDRLKEFDWSNDPIEEIEILFKALAPFLAIERGEVDISSSEMGKLFACRHLIRMTEDERISFFKGPFHKYDGNVYPVEWWKMFHHFDNAVFTEFFIKPLGEEAIHPILLEPPEDRFLKYLRAIPLCVDIEFGTPEPNEVDSISAFEASKSDFFEFMDIQIDTNDVAFFMASHLSNDLIESCGNVILRPKDEPLCNFREYHPDAQLARLDFRHFDNSEKSLRLIRDLGKLFQFEEKFERLLVKVHNLTGRQVQPYGELL